MVNKAFLLVFDRTPSVDYIQTHNQIKKSPNIVNWWHFQQSSYILISPLEAPKLGEVIRKHHLPNHRFLLIEMKGSNYAGWLPRSAWVWIKKYVK